VAEQELEIDFRPIKPGDRLTGLSLGEEFVPLKTFLQRKARKFEDKNLARTYAAFHGTKIVGYITLVCGEVSVKDGDSNPIDEDDYDYKHFPAIKVARLAVDSKRRKFGIGRTLVELALGIAKDTICPAVGCRFVMVDSKKQSMDFYVKCGFTMLDTQENRDRDHPIMFIDLHKLPKPNGAANSQ
jgi:GNAT superfamily N-acetyltransferase